MKCYKCGINNPKENKYCNNCGVLLKKSSDAIICAKCGSENLPSRKFCGKCGIGLDKTSQFSAKMQSTGDKMQKWGKETRQTGMGLTCGCILIIVFILLILALL